MPHRGKCALLCAMQSVVFFHCLYFRSCWRDWLFLAFVQVLILPAPAGETAALPPRPFGARKGREVARSLEDLNLKIREALLQQEILLFSIIWMAGRASPMMPGATPFLIATMPAMQREGMRPGWRHG